MLGYFLNMFRSEIENRVAKAVASMTRMVKREAREKSWVRYYGSPEVDPAALTFWVCVVTDKEKTRLKSHPTLVQDLRQQLKVHGYPAGAADAVHIGVESQETVDRVSNGNWWGHWK